jgi:hypothetical protein
MSWGYGGRQVAGTGGTAFDRVVHAATKPARSVAVDAIDLVRSMLEDPIVREAIDSRGGDAVGLGTSLGRSGHDVSTEVGLTEDAKRVISVAVNRALVAHREPSLGDLMAGALAIESPVRVALCLQPIDWDAVIADLCAAE